jgi:hypothetical protein
MQASILTALSATSDSLGAYLRPALLLSLLTFTNTNGTVILTKGSSTEYTEKDEKQCHDHVEVFDVA